MQHRFFGKRYDYGKWSFNFRVFIDYDFAKSAAYVFVCISRCAN